MAGRYHYYWETHILQFGGRQIPFDLAYCNRKRLTISVHPDQKVTVKVPLGKSFDEVLKRIEKHAAWILKQRHYFEQFRPLPQPRQYVSGETYLYLGRQYRLKVLKEQEESVKLIGRYLWVRTKRPDYKSKVKTLLEVWYKAHSRLILENRLAICLEAASRAGIPEPTVKYRKMRRRWGSCHSKSAIILNTELVKAPLHCIDYVITHELCHLKHKNHGPGFHRLLSRLMPDWEMRKEKLSRAFY